MSKSGTSDIAHRLEQLTELSLQLGTRHDTTVLLEKILRTARTMANADGGTLYRTSADRRSLAFSISLNDTLKMYQGGVAGAAIEMPDIPLFDAAGSANMTAVAACAFHTRRSVNIGDVYRDDVFNFLGMRRFDETFGYRSRSILTVPMQDHEGEVIGVLQLINARDAATGAPCAFSHTDQRLIEALASQGAIALTNQQLIARLEDLFEGFVKLINIGIDEKSPHTGRHCEAVPELTMMLADAAHRAGTGPLADFRMSDADRRQLWIAGLLHDCGKITTPVHVVEKATKLQTIFDRIHLVDTRLEVVRREAEIRSLKEKLRHAAEPARHAAIDRALAAELAGIDDDRAFLRQANIGSEGMSGDDQRRVGEIAARRRFIGPDGNERPLLDEEEIANLCVRAGTLNPQEREIINNHISVTIRMLESLPWPAHLRRVPEYAGGHHERMDGQGYPRGLRGDQMPLQARMMAIADIFEALTAPDRPYKKGKMLSESLRILGGFRERNHIDPDLFDIFIREKVYLEYARRFMDPAQIDEVDERQIPGYVP
ncbi:GAF and HD-GYP domain-containing protein [Noviherbaspirillum aridicola]|uniref:Phosphohydrolase n=1 Tax=Noviherbaspirillum aridicola TaxID=2849687 RepID=A0ABQ4Q326_9BURK|nr:HD family phosphohydrolase [Noviherbaspirillum aridicola]GIZ51431.1 phosphohydrolase [Noviherbaspirillum aridicola]